VVKIQSTAVAQQGIYLKGGVTGMKLRITKADDSKVDKALFAPILKVDEAQRLVYGVVLEPEVVDSQDDIVSADEIRQACWKYMEQHQNVGVQHAYISPSILVRECYIAPVDFMLGTEMVKAGSWVMGVGVYDEGVWQGVLNKEFTGFSIGGYAIREPE